MPENRQVSSKSQRSLIIWSLFRLCSGLLWRRRRRLACVYFFSVIFFGVIFLRATFTNERFLWCFTRPLGRVIPLTNLPFPCFSNNPPSDHNPRTYRHSCPHWDALWFNRVSLSYWFDITLSSRPFFLLLILSFYIIKLIRMVGKSFKNQLFSDYYWEQFDKNVTKRNMIG